MSRRNQQDQEEQLAPAVRYAQQRLVQICGQCKYYYAGSPDPTIGLCKRYPPQIVTIHTPVSAHFPPISSLDTCGEFAQ